MGFCWLDAVSMHEDLTDAYLEALNIPLATLAIKGEKEIATVLKKIGECGRIVVLGIHFSLVDKEEIMF
jgi:hypothetical protein